MRFLKGLAKAQQIVSPVANNSFKSISKRSVQLLALACLLLVIAGLSFFGARTIKLLNSTAPFKAIYFLQQFKEGPELLDPLNTETVWEYYLLENLSCGLIRDSKTSASGYAGCLAERFYQPNPNTWIFKIRNLSWSDGSEVSKFEIETWITQLQKKNSRHIQFLKTADSVSYDPESRELRIHFPTPDPGMVLHELSLADAGLFPTDYRLKGWKRVIGPYSVANWDKSSNQLFLSANKYSPLYSPDMPQFLELREMTDINLRKHYFKSIDVDLIPLGALADIDRVKDLLPNAPQIYLCHPTMILFFAFNKSNQMTSDPLARTEFARIIESVRSNFDTSSEFQSTLKIETQMIPEGFNGRLNPYNEKQPNESSVLKGKNLKLRLTSAFRNKNSILENLKTSFAKSDISLDIHFSDSYLDPDKDDFAFLSAFVGNQLDPSGSWSFLLYSPQGVLFPWLPKLDSRFSDFSNSPSNFGKPAYFLDLHQEILSKHIAVPFLVGSQRYLLSERVDASLWNRFDSRARFYDLRMK